MDNGERLARKFHDTYERLAPDFGYETRDDTKAFDPSTPNGKLMIAVCTALASDVAPANKETSSRVSSIAAKLVNFGPTALVTIADDEDNDAVANFCADIRTLAGSALSQDETPGQSEIHPAPVEFSNTQIAVDPLLHFFHYSHLPPTLQATSRMFFLLAHYCVNNLPRSAERTVALRKLLEAKDSAVRANLPAPKMQGGRDERLTELKWKPAPIGEPVETGGHDEDRDGPIPFDG